MLVVLLPKLWFWIENRDWHNCFWMSLWLFVGWTLTGPKKASKSTFSHNRLNKEKTMCWCCQSRYLILWRTIECFWNHFLVEGLINAMLVVLLPKLWFGLKIMTGHNCFWMSSWGSPLLDPKKLQNQQFLNNRLNKKKILVDVANLATCCHDDYDALLEILGTLGKCYVSSPVAKTLVLDWKSWLAQLFLDVFLGLTHPYWTQKSFKTNNFT